MRRVSAEVPLRCIPSTSNACAAFSRRTFLFALLALLIRRNSPRDLALVGLRGVMVMRFFNFDVAIIGF